MSGEIINHGPALSVQSVRPVRGPGVPLPSSDHADFLALAEALAAPVFTADPSGTDLHYARLSESLNWSNLEAVRQLDLMAANLNAQGPNGATGALAQMAGRLQG